jgi:hypothetical protein
VEDHPNDAGSENGEAREEGKSIKAPARMTLLWFFNELLE